MSAAGRSRSRCLQVTHHSFRCFEVVHRAEAACRVVSIEAPALPGLEEATAADAARLRAHWLERLSLPDGAGAEVRLRQRLDRAVVEAGLPAMAPVLPPSELSVEAEEDPCGRRPWLVHAPLPPPEDVPGLSDRLERVLAVLSKSSPRVFLASRTPLLSNLLPGRKLVLLLPFDWRLP